MLPEEELSNFELFRDCLATPLIEKSAVEPSKEKRRRRAAAGGRRGAKIVKPVVSERQERENDAEELGEFVDVRPEFICSSQQVTERFHSTSPLRPSFLSLLSCGD